MKKFLVLYQSEGALNGPSVSEMFARATPEQLKAGLGVWRAWQEKSGSAIVDLGTPLDHSTTVTRDASSPSKTTITGYSVLQADSLKDALALMKGHPHFFMPGASAQVLECVPLPGM
jgi:hypothetical protein